MTNDAPGAPSSRATELSQRFCLAAFEEGGVLLDLLTGGYFQVNASGAWLLERALDSGVEAAAVAGAARWNVSPDRVRGDLQHMLQGGQGIARKAASAQVAFQADENRTTLLWEGVPAIEACSDGLIRMLPAALDGGWAPSPLVHMLLPKAAALVGLAVLHASAVQIQGTTVAISGESGAGKSTIAAALVGAGARKVVEDLLVLPPAGGAALVRGGEQRLLDWKTRAVEALQRDGRADLTSLRGIDTGDASAVGAILLLDPLRRVGDRFRLQPLSRPEATSAVLENVFVGVVTPTAWRRHLATAARIAAGTRCHLVTAPAGLQALDSAAGDLYSVMCAS